MKNTLEPLFLHDEAEHNFRREARIHDLMVRYETAKGNPDQSLRWNGASREAGVFPEVCVKNPWYDNFKRKNVE